MEKITVFIYDQKEYKQWKDFYNNHQVLNIEYGNIFNTYADCLVTAGNSYGMMDGGIDGHVNYFFDGIEKRVQQKILKQWYGELPVGASLVFETPNNQHFKHLCYAPTMRTPMNVSLTNNAYLAMRGALVQCAKYPSIKTIAVPMLCRGVGCMSCENILRQIRHAYSTFVYPTPRKWSAIVKESHGINTIEDTVEDNTIDGCYINI